jgi:hypothetical protein
VKARRGLTWRPSALISAGEIQVFSSVRILRQIECAREIGSAKDDVDAVCAGSTEDDFAIITVIQVPRCECAAQLISGSS